MANNYTPTAPSIATTITNGSAPSGWKFMGLSSTEDVQRRPQATMDGTINIVGVPSVVYTPVYFTMKPIAAGVVVLELVDGTAALTVGGKAFDNVYLIGGSLTFQNTGRGVIGSTYTQDFLTLGQRVSYA